MQASSWGNYPIINNSVRSYKNHKELRKLINENTTSITFGNGRSYGDSALNKNIITTKKSDNFISFDKEIGILHCQAGVTLSKILDLIIPQGWFLSVTPGTKLITVGGAIAADVHGKNHHISGSFSDNIIDFKLMLPNGKIITCSKNQNYDFWLASCGGMGLTGIILEARIKLQAIKSAQIKQTTIKTKNLQETFEAFEKFKDTTYSVAWIDCLAKKESIGRCILMLGEHALEGELLYENKRKISIPINFPSISLNKFTVGTFNQLYYHKNFNKESQQTVDIDTFFYPLDSINQWNKIYGKNGFTQYQFVLPIHQSYEGLKEVLTKISTTGKGSFLAVLKLFGKGNQNWLSFPMEGYTLALDFKIEPGLFELLNELDKIVLKHKGRFYLAKDSRISQENFEQGYPQINIFRKFRKHNQLDKYFSSIQSERVNI